MFVPPFGIKFVLIHLAAFSIISCVAHSIDNENNAVPSLNAIMLKESIGSRFDMASSSAVFTDSMGPPCMLALVSTTKIITFLKTYNIPSNV